MSQLDLGQIQVVAGGERARPPARPAPAASFIDPQLLASVQRREPVFWGPLVKSSDDFQPED